MNSGALRHRVTFQQLNPSSNPFQQGDGWTNIATLWAQITPLTQKEVFQISGQNMKVSHKVTIRYPGASVQIVAGMRILFKNRTFELQTGITNAFERNIQLDLFAFELNPTQ